MPGEQYFPVPGTLGPFSVPGSLLYVVPVLPGDGDAGSSDQDGFRGGLTDAAGVDQPGPVDAEEAAAEDGFPAGNGGLVAVGSPVGEMDIDLRVAGFNIEDTVLYSVSLIIRIIQKPRI